MTKKIKISTKGISCSYDPERDRYTFIIQNSGKRKKRSHTNQRLGLQEAEEILAGMKRGQQISGDAQDLLHRYLARTVLKKRQPEYIEAMRTGVARMWDEGLRDVTHPDFENQAIAWLNKAKCSNSAKPLSRGSKRTYLNWLRMLVKQAYKDGLITKPMLTTDDVSIPIREEDRTRTREIFEVREMQKMTSPWFEVDHKSRWHQARRAMADASNDVHVAAKRLKVHWATIYNWLKKDEAPTNPYWLYNVILLYTGMRSSEAYRLQWDWIDWDRRIIRCHETKIGKGWRPIFIEKELLEILEDRRQDKGRVCAGVSKDVPNRSRGIQRLWKHMGIHANGRTPHCLRHNWIAWHAAMGVNDKMIELTAGHDDKAVSKLYASHAVQYKLDAQKLGWTQFQEFRLKSGLEYPVILEEAI